MNSEPNPEPGGRPEWIQFTYEAPVMPKPDIGLKPQSFGFVVNPPELTRGERFRRFVASLWYSYRPHFHFGPCDW